MQIGPSSEVAPSTQRLHRASSLATGGCLAPAVTPLACLRSASLHLLDEVIWVSVPSLAEAAESREEWLTVSGGQASKGAGGERAMLQAVAFWFTEHREGSRAPILNLWVASKITVMK